MAKIMVNNGDYGTVEPLSYQDGSKAGGWLVGQPKIGGTVMFQLMILIGSHTEILKEGL